MNLPYNSSLMDKGLADESRLLFQSWKDLLEGEMGFRYTDWFKVLTEGAFCLKSVNYPYVMLIIYILRRNYTTASILG